MWIGRYRSIPRSCVSISTAPPFPGSQGALLNYKKFGQEPADHAIGRSRGGLSTKTHLVADGRGRPLGFVLTGGQVADTIMLPATINTIRVPRSIGRPRTRPARVIADKGYPSKNNRAFLRRRGIKATIPERRDQILHRSKHPGRPLVWDQEQRSTYRNRNIVERTFNRLKQWRGIAMRANMTARNYHAALTLAATLDWLKTTKINAA